MAIVFLDEHEVLTDQGLSLVPLIALTPDADLFSQFIMQPSGIVDADISGVHNRNSQQAASRHNAFIELASEENAALLITPEYSTPWDAVRNLLDNGTTPEPGALWVLGCESITPEELQELSKNYPNICWIFETIQPTKTQTFLDPVCIVFNCQNAKGEYQLVIAIQFKAQCMVDHQCYLERNHMLKGTQRYVLRNNGDSIHLAVLVCSDALNFSCDQLPNPLHTPYLILHLQLNTDPFHATFKNYRSQTYIHSGENYEFVCVNWATGSSISIEDAGAITTRYGGSAYYNKTPDVDLEDGNFNVNHKYGLYFTYCSSLHFNMYCFNYSEHVFEFQTTKTSQRMAAAALRKRTGPSMLAARTWDKDSNSWISCESTNDGFAECCQTLGVNEDIFEGKEPLDTERLIALSTGNVSKSRYHEWFHPAELLTLRADSDETIYRITFTHHPNEEAQEKRARLLRQTNRLAREIITDGDAFPTCISDLSGDCLLQAPRREQAFSYNLVDAAGCKVAAGAYIGDASSMEAARKFDVIANVLPESARRRLVVWYHDGPNLHHEVQTGKPKFTDDPKLDRRSFVRD